MVLIVAPPPLLSVASQATRGVCQSQWEDGSFNWHVQTWKKVSRLYLLLFYILVLHLHLLHLLIKATTATKAIHLATAD